MQQQFNQPIKDQYTIREFANLKGMPTNAGQLPLTDSEGNDFKAQGMSFGTCFVTFSKSIMDEHPNQNAYQVATDVLKNSSKYQVIKKPGVVTKSGSAVYTICHYRTKVERVGGSLASIMF